VLIDFTILTVKLPVLSP